MVMFRLMKNSRYSSYVYLQSGNIFSVSIHSEKSNLNLLDNMIFNMKLDSNNYSSSISKGIVVVKFSTRRCAKCKLIESWYKSLDSDVIVYHEADLDEVFEFDEVDTITSVPAFVKYIDGNHVLTICSGDIEIIEKNLL